MEANRVVLYFDKQEDALLFTLAASSAMSQEPSVPTSKTAVQLAAEVRKASRVTAEGILNKAEG